MLIGERGENDALRRRLAEQTAKMNSLQKMMLRAKRKDDSPDDGEVQRQFLVLKSDILQFVRAHLCTDSGLVLLPSSIQDASSEVKELFLRSVIANLLHQHFHPPCSLLFGINDHLKYKNPFWATEERLRRRRTCEGMVYIDFLFSTEVHRIGAEY